MKAFNYKNSSLLLGLLLLNVILGLPGLWIDFYCIDEVTNGIYAQLIQAGDLSLKDFLGSTYLLTHYLSYWFFEFFSQHQLIWIHAFHTLWKCLIILVFYKVGQNLFPQHRRAGLWSGLFYCLCSVSFLSKEFHTPIAENFSLLPGIISVLLFFKALDSHRKVLFLFAGIFIGFAVLFKMTIGVILIAQIIVILFYQKPQKFFSIVFLGLGFWLVFLSPILFVSPLGSGFTFLLQKITETHQKYLTSYESSSLYLILKFLLRTSLLSLSFLGMTFFAFFGIKKIQQTEKHSKQKIIFLLMSLVFLWLTTLLGKRVFFHYFIFVLLPLPLLAEHGIHLLSSVVKNTKISAFSFFEKIAIFFRRFIFIVLLIPALGFSFEGATNLSTSKMFPVKYKPVVEYLLKTTTSTDRIYVWGFIPQIYLESNRLPATRQIWSDILVGISPGSRGMLYQQRTGRKLDVLEKIKRDFVGFDFLPQEVRLIGQNDLNELNDKELLTLEEMLEIKNDVYWNQVMADFFKNPPKVIIDISATNYLWQGYFPIQNYEILRRFIKNHYQVDDIKNGIVLYRLKIS